MLIFSAAMAFPMMAMVIAMDIRIICQSPCKQRLHSFICTTRYTAIKTDACFCQNSLRTYPNSSADQRIHVQLRQQP